MNQKLLEKFINIARAVSERNGGPFRLFALLSRRESSSGWEVVVSAEWDNRNSHDVLKEVANEIQSQLTGQDLLSIARVFTIDAAQPEVEALTRSYHVNYEIEPVQAVNIGNAVFDGYFIVSRRNEIAAQVHRPAQTSDQPLSNDYKLNFGQTPISRFNASVAPNMIRETK